ncbi:MAG: alpha/beta hydrolase family protein [Hyphomicrobiaceae bacterium]
MRGCFVFVLCLALLSTGVRAADRDGVGYRQITISDPKDPARRLAVAMFYPAMIATDAKPFVMPFFKELNFYEGAQHKSGKHPLILFSHGRGSNPLNYSWILQLLAANGYVVAAPFHYRANTYDATIAYLANNLWQRPRDLSMIIDVLSGDASSSPFIDTQRVGVAGHSQGGFTSLWIAGAEIDPERYATFQRRWKANPMVPAHLREDLSVDPSPAVGVHDPRIRAAFAMAPGIIQAFGMSARGLANVKVPVHITVGARDTQTPPNDNAEFAAAHIPGTELVILPGDVDHEIFVNECDQEGRDEFPEACIDAPSVDRAALHARIGAHLLRFFGKTLR